MVYARAGATPSTDPDRLAEPLRSIVKGLIASGQGVTLVSGWRSPAQQIDLRREHCGPSHYDIYEKPSSQCRPPTARPGTSKHEKGLAADLGGNLAYVEAQASRLGIAQTVAGERWHWEYVGGGSGAPAPSSAAGASTSTSAAGDSGDITVANLLTDGRTWLRIITVLGGIALLWSGVQRIIGDMLGLDPAKAIDLAANYVGAK